METRHTIAPSLNRKLAKMEHQRSYASNQAAIAALELATALSTVLTRRLGPEFADELRGELRARAESLRADDFASQCTANIVAELADWPIWKSGH